MIICTANFRTLLSFVHYSEGAGWGGGNARPENETSGSCYAQLHTEQRSRPNARQLSKIEAINSLASAWPGRQLALTGPDIQMVMRVFNWVNVNLRTYTWILRLVF